MAIEVIVTVYENIPGACITPAVSSQLQKQDVQLTPACFVHIQITCEVTYTFKKALFKHLYLKEWISL